MKLPAGSPRELNLAVPAVIALLTLSLLIAAPFRPAAASQTSQVSSQVVPTVLSGYRSAGALPGSTPVFVTLGIPLQNLQALEYLTQQISTPGSSTYHHFLTQGQIQSFLPVAEYQKAVAYLNGLGLKIVSSSLDSIVVAEGTAAQVSQSLGLRYEVYTDGQSSYYTSSGSSPVSGAYLYSSNFTAALLERPMDLVTSSTISAVDSSSPSQTNQTTASEAYPLTDLQSVYNATGLYAAGDTGAGYTAGILDFYGDPYIAQQLQYFDQLYGVPASPFTVTSIGPYNPSLGVYEGWDGEISLDVESVHAMAPHAGIDLYIANAALPLSSAIATIVQQDKVNDLSQSFGFPEYQFSNSGVTSLEMNVVLADQYYLLGSAEGITFIASTGDIGGSGYSAGPDGTTEYPSTSPYVVAVGGTTTYLDYQGKSVSSFYQTAWSNYGFVPNQINYGGGTGGVSVLEPKPWYQSGLPSPPGFPSGRLVPDLSLNANVYPGIVAVLPGNETGITGGTSESDQLLAGLLTLLMSASKSGLGLLNPTLYAFGQSSSVNAKVYYPITFGYIIPWVASAGYNLATGWGAPNVGEMAHYIDTVTASPLNVNVTALVNGAFQFNVFPGQVVTVSSIVTNGQSPVLTGAFSAQLDTLSGVVATTALTYDASSHAWSGELTVPNDAAGLSYVNVNGTSQGRSGVGFTELFAGYVATFLSPSANSPYSAQFGTPVEVNITTLSGAPATGALSVSALTYSIESNAYAKVATVPLALVSVNIWSGTLSGKYADGPMLLVGDGDVYGYLPFINGVGLQGSFIETSVLVEPGAAGPGQSIFILASLAAPVNLPALVSQETGLPVSYNVEEGSNVTATLVSPSGKTVATSQLYLNSYLSSEEVIQGVLTVPSGLPPGLYDVILSSTYNSYDLKTTIDGSYFGQVYIAPALTTTSISITPSTAFEGQTVAVNAKIAYANGTSVKYGVYSATVYPKDLQNAYNGLTETLPVPLWYDSSTGFWTANLVLPSAYNTGGTVQLDPGALYLSGPYDVFISGVSADGVPSNTDISTQQQLVIQPYLYLNDTTLMSFPQTSQVAFVGDTLVGPAVSSSSAPSAVLTDDLFSGSNTFQGGTVTISQSQIQGTLYLKNANVTFVGVSGGDVVAQDSQVILQQSSLSSLSLTNSHVSMNASTVRQITPSLPSISIQEPVSGGLYNGTSGDVVVIGAEVSAVSIYLDGALLKTLSGGEPYTFPLGAASMSVGVHTLEVVAAQQDGLSSSSSVYFSTDGPLVAANNSISSLTTQVSSENSRIGALSSRLGSATDLSYGLAAVAVLALIIAVVALARRPSAKPATTPPTSPPSPPETPPAPDSPQEMPPATQA
ncbi:MAG: protease pro-enzyme activation domain-containing protein [Thaumarchaeota archaeon]|nr:protease pro-enzyme activation domain-containing protein [Nitrososphaerota archaeon]